MKSGRRRLGIDIGRGIICAAADDNRDTSFLRVRGDAAVKTPPSSGMFETSPRLVEHFAGEVWLTSKGGSFRRVGPEWAAFSP